MPGGAAELAVGGRLQADLVLQADNVADGLVLDLAQGRIVDGAGGVLLARPVQGGGPQQAADVVGPERRTGALGHGR